MKKIICYRLVLFLVLVCGALNASSEAVASKTFFMPRPLASDLAMLNACTHDFIFKHEPAPQFFINFTAFYQDAMNHGDLARYFMPACKRELVIAGAFADLEPDISGTWLQIAGKNTPNGAGGFPLDGVTTRSDVELYLNEYSSKISMSPTYQNYGFLMQSYHNLDRCAKRLWCSFDFPFMQAETAVNPSECDIENAATTRSMVSDFIISAVLNSVQRHERATLQQSLSALEAINNPEWSYGKITRCSQKLAGLADIQFKLGYDLLRYSAFRLNPYVRLSIPTSAKPTARYMFEPVLGNAGHWGLGAGVFADVAFVRGESFNFALSAGIDYLYVLSADERRSMDLVNNGDWSRYLLVVDTRNEPDPNTRTLYPGINFFTRKVNVRPKHDVNILGSLRMGFSGFFFEGGYNLWVKSAEEVCLKDGLPEGIAIAGTSFGARDTAEAFQISTFSTANISSHISSTSADTPANRPVVLTSADLNTASAAHPKRVTHKLFVSLGADAMWAENPVRLAVGGSYEFGDRNKSLDLWGLFVKVNLFV